MSDKTCTLTNKGKFSPYVTNNGDIYGERMPGGKAGVLDTIQSAAGINAMLLSLYANNRALNAAGGGHVLESMKHQMDALRSAEIANFAMADVGLSQDQLLSARALDASTGIAAEIALAVGRTNRIICECNDAHLAEVGQMSPSARRQITAVKEKICPKDKQGKEGVPMG